MESKSRALGPSKVRAHSSCNHQLFPSCVLVFSLDLFLNSKFFSVPLVGRIKMFGQNYHVNMGNREGLRVGNPRQGHGLCN